MLNASYLTHVCHVFYFLSNMFGGHLNTYNIKINVVSVHVNCYDEKIK